MLNLPFDHQKYTFTVVMTCSGCSNAVNRVDNIDIDLDTQQVIVESESLTREEVLAAIKKTGKEVKE
ncbi:hypothetical protein CLU79DRAFT_838827 [Phycomyces nitens]|nr:hypothetical protein CLU79DRAFT_838827 [Phycomyces nitens]